ncbi:MAG: hypothetical protein P1U56_06795 [Saprospiraceae bacterium]|nr:hypothetical protein [Saprospiraceae bacterium]
MKNLVSKLFGGLAVAAFVFGSFTSTDINAQPVTMSDLTIEDVKVEEVAAADWYALCGSDWCLVVKDSSIDGDI